MRYLMFLLALLFANMANAIDCQTLPSCTELGYSQTQDPNCAAGGVLNCPFDATYTKCVLPNCEAQGFTKEDKRSWCAEIVPCETDATYTLCGDSCFAWDYNRLSTLAETDKCKVITLMNDIDIPDGSKVFVHEGVTIDGGSHTINTHGTQKDYVIFRMKDETGLKNINFVHHHVGNHGGLRLINVDKIDQAITDEMVYLENVNIHIEADDTETPSSETALLFRGNYTFTGNFDWYLSASDRTGGFKNFSGKRIFKNAHMKAFVDGKSGAAFQGNYYSFEDSTFEFAFGDMKNNLTNMLYGDSSGDYNKPLVMEIKNSTVSFMKPHGSVMIRQLNSETMKIILHEGGILNFSATETGREFINTATTSPIEFYLSGKPDNPAQINITTQVSEVLDTTGKATVIAGNLTDKFILNGKTYQPVTLGSTLLKDLTTSPNWKLMSDN